MIHRILTGLLVVLMLLTVGCASPQGKDQSAGKPVVVTTLYPQYDFVRHIAKDKVDAVILLAPGVEAHSYEPTPQDIVTIEKSLLFIYTGEAMEPWAHKMVETLGDSINVVDASENVPLIEMDDHDDGNEDVDHSGHDHGSNDPHIWLDPLKAEMMVSNIVKGLVEADPQNREFYETNGASYIKELEGLDQAYVERLEKYQHREIVVGGHFAFGHLAARYDLEVISAYDGFSPDAEPTPKRIAELISIMKEHGTTVIYHEELVDPKVAEVIASETGAKLLMLHGAHNVSKDELESGITYIDIMLGNLDRLEEGLR